MKDMRRLSDNEVADQLRSAHEDLLDAKFKHFRTLPQTRRKIARLRTVMAERANETETEQTGG